ncbi:hypothetical protein Cob_v000497 [Colletotrichum orbiculare MAFF 240422]|uniref:Major facilitator superfamily transporter n=1 Tax=Colletotrichum orbiculare (strain 104-T / ATCC 96160 / CBS 514.97 / LARS 414 / MAFF 240422) TaxID=1213857 RepID=N4VMD9_COLOR|nr:hypothetical protein Cob_v000497 [Colletotrichum orbiculare MAFF 240422]
MERAQSLLTSTTRSISSTRSSTRSSRSNSLYLPTPGQEKGEFFLPPPSTTIHQPKIRVRAILGHCLYRRVVIWTVTISFLLALAYLNAPLYTRDGRILADDYRIGGLGGQPNKHGNEIPDEYIPEITGDMPPWLKFKHLNGYFNGLKSIVPIANHTPEYPNASFPAPVKTVPIYHDTPPTPTPYVAAYPDYESRQYQRDHVPVRECFIDEDDQIPVPDIYAYDGVPQNQPEPAIGSHTVLGLRNDICFDRFGRYGPYGLGYDIREGGTSQGHDTEQEGADAVWSKTGRINYSRVDWGMAQDRCVERNIDRFRNSTKDAGSGTAYDTMYSEPDTTETGIKKIDRIAVIIRTYVGFEWTQHAILNFRAMISELVLKSGGEYSVHFLLHVKDNDAAIWSDPSVVQKILDDNVPTEFHSLCTLWSEAEMRLYYPGHFADALENPSNGDIHGVYRSAQMPLQVFALQHPEYSHFWNWEMDMRYIGSYYELLDRLGSWARQQSRNLLWERSSKYYIPAVHGSWDEFATVVEKELNASGRRAILGPQIFPGRMSLKAEEAGVSFMPANCNRGAADAAECGVGEEADLITLNPLFDADESGWVFAKDVTGYEMVFAPPPRRCAIVTASRLSRRLLAAMHEEMWRMHHSMFSEMFPASMALHHGFKAAYAPHPVYLDRAWYPYNTIEKAFNGGRDGTTGGHGSPFDLKNEHNHKGTSWYYNSEFAGLLWRRWLGYGQMDGRGTDGGRANEGTLRGGLAEESRADSSGRLCMRSMLVHPIKWENPIEKE